jgi:ribonucleoside-diphosphate reductase alpha chain
MKQQKLYEEYIHLSRYARYLPEEGRRETWPETVNRFTTFFAKELGSSAREVEKAIINKEVMPSMRALMTAGPALSRDNVAGYNCAYVSINKLSKFSEAMYILMCGTGVGFSVLQEEVAKMPEVADAFFPSDTVIKVPDSKIGWAKAYKELLSMLYMGHIPSWDLSKLRPAGAPLKTFGGRASGPGPLDKLFIFTTNIIKSAAGRKLTSLECHDIMCNIADAIVVGGVRRSALISLSDLNDREMQLAKHGAWWDSAGHRALANNSAVYNGRPSLSIFMDEWRRMYDSKSGERGIFNQQAVQIAAGRNGRRKTEGYIFGTNPCSEIILRDRQFCNLTEVIIRDNDTVETLKEKVRIATIIGTVQSTLTDFRFLPKEWRENCEEERLLGVSLTGICDNSMLNSLMPRDMEHTRDILEVLKGVAIQTNKLWAKRLGVNASTAITCVKPSGTVSQLCGTASGIHPRYSPYYIRSVRADKKDPLAAFMIEAGVPHADAPEKPDDMYVFAFPIKSPAGSWTKDTLSSVEQLKLWRVFAQAWCEHKPSMTCYYGDDSFLAVGAWVYENFNEVSGISFLPVNDHIYKHPPYQEITKEEYEQAVATFPDIDWSKFKEAVDNTTGTQELACSAGVCEVV